MELKSNIPQLIERLERIKIQVGGSGGIPPNKYISDVMFNGLNSAMGVMKNRIFNKGMDAEGQPLGKYIGKKSKVTEKKFGGNKKFRKNLIDVGEVTEYEKLRLAHGRFIDKKDLQFSGGLFSSIEPVRLGDGRIVIAIPNAETAAISTYQEQQIGNIRANGTAKGNATPARIFSFSEAELNHMTAEIREGIRQSITKIIEESK